MRSRLQSESSTEALHAQRLRCCIFLILAFSSNALAQSGDVLQNAATPQQETTRSQTSATLAAKKEKEEERRVSALSLLNTLVNDVNQFRDQALRARSQARVADALWDLDVDLGRSLFRKAWESAEQADRSDEPSSTNKSSQKPSKSETTTRAREEVLRLLMRRDRALAEEFLEMLKADEERESETRNQMRSSLLKSLGLSSADLRRLELAEQLLKSREVKPAIQVAEPALRTVSAGSIEFLSNLRHQDPSEADRRFAALLTLAGSQPQADANTISLLSSYLFTPHLIVVFTGRAAFSAQTTTIAAPVDVIELRTAFFALVVNILLRSASATPRPDRDSVEATYLVIKRLLPIFEQYASKEITETVRAQLHALSTMVEGAVRDRDDEKMHAGINSATRANDREQALLTKIDRTGPSADRDDLYLQLALLLAEKGETRARDVTDKIENTELRSSVRAYVDLTLVFKSIASRDPEATLEILRTADLTHPQRVWVLAQLAKQILSVDRDKAINLLDDALISARRIDGSDPDRPRALFGVANAFYSINPERSFEIISEAVKAANSAERFTGEDGQIRFSLRNRGVSYIKDQRVPDFDVAGIFGLAAADYHKSVELARGFQREAPRVNATIAIARSVLNAK